ncbi:MAG: hypothetical protein ACREVC_10825 [Burkholderiales bacterium]
MGYLDPLSSAVVPSSSFGYGYDAVGNRLNKTVGASADTYTYSATSNQIASITPATGLARSFTFDANGSTTNDGVNQYAYAAAGRRSSVGGSFARTGLPDPVSSATFDANNGASAWNGTSLSYDANGKLLGFAGDTYT